MKVLMFGWEFPPYISGGLGTACLGLTQSLSKLGTEVSFVMPKAEGDRSKAPVNLISADEIEVTLSHKTLHESLDEDTIRFIQVDSMLQPYLNTETYNEKLQEYITQNKRIMEEHQEVYQGTLEFNGKYGGNLMEEISRFAVVGGQLGKNRDFDVIHAHDWMTYMAGVEAKRSSGKALVVHIHATEFDRSGSSPNPDVYEIEKYGLTNADRVIAVSQKTKDTVVYNYGLDPNKVFVVHNAVSKDKTRERQEVKRYLDEKIVLFLGRITMQKGPEYFIEAARRVLDEVGNVRFVMAGSGDMLPKMVELIAKYRLQKHFHFTGFLRGTDVEDMFAMSDVYVMPSVSEPFGITPFEAMLYHVPVIISKQSGIAEVLPHALKVDFWDVKGLAQTIKDILLDDDYATELADAGARELDDISWDTAAQKVIEHYKEMV